MLIGVLPGRSALARDLTGVDAALAPSAALDPRSIAKNPLPALDGAGGGVLTSALPSALPSAPAPAPDLGAVPASLLTPHPLAALPPLRLPEMLARRGGNSCKPSDRGAAIGSSGCLVARRSRSLLRR